MGVIYLTCTPTTTDVAQSTESQHIVCLKVKYIEAIAKPRPPRVGSAPRADRGGRGATALPGFAIASQIRCTSRPTRSKNIDQYSTSTALSSTVKNTPFVEARTVPNQIGKKSNPTKAEDSALQLAFLHLSPKCNL